MSDYQRKITGLPALGRAIGAAKTGKCRIVTLDIDCATEIHEYLWKHLKRDYQRSYQRQYRKRIRLKAKSK